MTRFLGPVLIVAALLAGAAITNAGSPASAQARASCANLTVPPGLKAQLRHAYRVAHTGTKRGFHGPLAGSTYYGRCGTTRWAAATFSTNGLGTGDQPETFRRVGGTWKDRGDDGAICQVPAALRTIWMVPCV